MSKCVPELYRKCSVHDLQVHIECVFLSLSCVE